MDTAVLADEKLNEILNSAVERIVDDYRPERIILFGSHAYGRPDAESDFDLLIIKETKDRAIDRRVAVRKILRPLRSRPVVAPLVVTKDELSERLAMGDPFAREIVTRGRVLYEQN